MPAGGLPYANVKDNIQPTALALLTLHFSRSIVGARKAGGAKWADFV
jgi:hypothetical protein